MNPQALLPPRRAVRVPMTSLIDVVFILLLFFMLSSGFRHERVVRMQGGAADMASSEVQTEPTRWLRLHPDGSVDVDDQRLSVDGPVFADRLDDWARQARPIVVAAQRTTSVQLLVSLLDRCARAGLVNVRIARSWSP